MPQPSQAAVLPSARLWASRMSTPLVTLTPTPSARLPRVRYQAVEASHSSQAGVIGKPPRLNSSGRESSTPIENTISGMPTKWVAMLRRSRWYAAYWTISSVALRMAVSIGVLWGGC